MLVVAPAVTPLGPWRGLACSLGSGLAFLGARSPILLLSALAFGAAVPQLAVTARPLLSEAAVVMTTGSFLAAALSQSELALTRFRFAAALAATWLLPGVFVGLASASMEVHPDLRIGLVLSVVGPPVASAAALAAILGLAPRLALWLTMPPLILSPISLPLLAGLFADDVTLDCVPIALRLIAMIGSAGALAIAIIGVRNRVPGILPSATAAGGISIIGLAVVGLTAASAARLAFSEDAYLFGGLLVLSIAVTIGLWVAGALLFRSLGAQEANTVGFLFGNRNQTLVWAAAGAQLAPMAEAYIVAAILPSLILPALIRLTLDARSAHQVRIHVARQRELE